MLAEKLTKSAFKHIEGEIAAYHDTKKEIAKLRNEIMNPVGFADENVGGGKSNLPGDPTANRAISLATHKKLSHLETVTNAIEMVYNRLPEHKKKLINLYYWTTPQTLTWEGIAQKMHISRRQALNWRNEIICYIGDIMGWR